MGLRSQRPRRAVLVPLAVALVVVVALLALAASPSARRVLALFRHSCPLDAENSAAPQDGFHRSQFPANFVFGTATSAYQVEGAIHEGGKGPSIWDNYTSFTDKILDGSNADIAADMYHRYEADIDLMSSMHVDAYRFSIAWTRIFPDGRGPKVSKEGIAYYNRLIDALLRRGIQPYVTLYHWDLPHHLQESIGGWLSPEIVRLFADYAEACFTAFGDRVKHWFTLNEPQQFSWLGFGEGVHPPARSSNRTISAYGNTSTEPYIVSHHALLAHATVYDLYRQKFQATQGGAIGMALDCEWGVPFSDSPDDIEATERRHLFQLGWFLDPIFFGDYPAVMREIAGARLPTFTEDEKALLHHSVDFIGLNHYTTKWNKNVPGSSPDNYLADQCVDIIDKRDGVNIGPPGYSFWLRVVPWGLGLMLDWVWDRYKTPIYISENGFDTENNQSLSQSLPADALDDVHRVEFYKSYLQEVLSATKKGVDIHGYFAWSFLDNFEWLMGYTSRFGLVYTDFATLKRYPKASYKWFAKLLEPRDGNRCRHDQLGFRFLENFRFTSFL